ncbi:MAG: tRNA (N6-isopentenyl adenosine(37)-C2)-methylthiotransferase MiaB [Rhodobacteraceae bacterium]|nr:tRNA (N6-isopentenyl adenosine(37)-C2)-methylthiotransferase MiaB [Paracoccaceae bacterium]
MSGKKVFIKTYGCQMNVYDSERMAEALAASGYEATGEADDADLVVLNTCHIREKATEKIYSELGRYKKRKAERPDFRIAVAGCVAQAEGEEIVRRQPLVDVVVGPQAYHRLPELLRRGGVQTNTDFPVNDKFAELPERAAGNRSVSSFLTVQEGCDKFCTFCVVPYTRGAETSRPVTQVESEALRLVGRGAREIVLLGQNVNAYHGTGPDGECWSLARLIRALARIEGLQRIRFTTSHPRDMSADLIEALGSCHKLMPYLHLPAQSGSDKILKAMNRRHTAEDYLRVIGRIRKARPDILISGDFIVGFPGETDADFADTLELVRKVHYGQAYSFRYSPRPGTPAAERPQVSPETAAERLDELQSLLRSQQREVQWRMVGRTVPVLFEKPGRRPGQLVGKSEYLHSVHCSAADELIGESVPVRIIRAEPNSLLGELA